ncbi:MAG: DUF4234 domain-containing protein [Candidatus Bathyarchaeota archaeon]|nr:DUF4234 domain-containing protein [Candidatus Bathyarchaeota archaeon]
MLENRPTEKVIWFSMWFLTSIATFGIGFFPMFYSLIESRNRHFQREAALEKQITTTLEAQGKKIPKNMVEPPDRNAIAWTIFIVLIVPVFILLYLLSKDLLTHEKHQDEFFTELFPERVFMPQTIPIKKYVLITIVTFGIGGIYWLYKIINNYNAHFKAQWKLEKEILRLMEENKLGKSL